jgi:hypothetical protein
MGVAKKGGGGKKKFFSDVALVTELANQMPIFSVTQLHLLNTPLSSRWWLRKKSRILSDSNGVQTS